MLLILFTKMKLFYSNLTRSRSRNDSYSFACEQRISACSEAPCDLFSWIKYNNHTYTHGIACSYDILKSINIYTQCSHSVGHCLWCVTSWMSREHFLHVSSIVTIASSSVKRGGVWIGLYSLPPASHTLPELVPEISESGQFPDLCPEQLCVCFGAELHICGLHIKR